MKVVVHNGRCHADDLFAVATLQIKFGDGIEVVRTRDEQAINSADVVVDVGHIYDGSKKRFDHHQQGGAGARENGIPYAAFGLVWKKFGEEICESPIAASFVDERLVQPVDANDNGFSIAEGKENMPEEFNFDSITKVFNPNWLEDESGHDKAFFDLLPFAKSVLLRVIEHMKAKEKGNKLAEDAYQKSENPKLLVLEGPYPFDQVSKKHPELLFVIAPDVFADRWNIRGIDEKNFKRRMDLPKEWGGLRGEELENLTGVSGAVFCHRGLHFCATKTKEAALAIAKLALDSSRT